MAFSIGQVLKGCKASYRIVKSLKLGTVYQAKITSTALSTVNGPQSSDFVVIKHEPRKEHRVVYDRERGNYAIPRIVQSPYIRKLRDFVDEDSDSEGATFLKPKEFKPRNQCMVFEWMDTDLWQLPSEFFRSGSKFPKIVARSVLEALVVLDELGGVHTDVNPNNVFVSNAHGSHPVVKLGDLGNLVVKRETCERFQGLYVRAPEVWRGVGLFPSSDVWSLGVTMAHWMVSNVLFGPDFKIIEGMTEAWCLAKLIRLIGPLEKPVTPEYEEEFDIAVGLERGTFTHPETGLDEPFIKLGTIRQELANVPGSKIETGCIDFIESLLVLDHTKRPSAKEALNHPWLQAINFEAGE